MRNLSIKAKLLSIVISSILIVSIVTIVESIIALNNTSNNIIEDFRKDAVESKVEELKNYVDLAFNTIKNYHEMSLKDVSNENYYKNAALEAVSKLRYGNDGYFWINNSKAVMIMHPISEALNGKDLSGLSDVKGKKFFSEMANIANNNAQGGLVDYYWDKPDKKNDPKPKFSYVKKFEPWDFIIGTGAYVDNIDTKVSSMKEKTESGIYNTMFVNIVIIFIIMIALAFIMLIISKKQFLILLKNSKQDY